MTEDSLFATVNESLTHYGKFYVCRVQIQWNRKERDEKKRKEKDNHKMKLL